MTASILTVDDSASLRMAIRIALTGAGYAVTEAGDGVEGLAKAAETRVKVQLLLAEIAQAEKLTVDEKDFNSWLMREAMRSGQRPDKLAKDLGKDRDQVRAVQQQLLFDKALDFLVSKATVKTVTTKA